MPMKIENEEYISVDTKLVVDGYPLLKQNTILSALGGAEGFSFLNMVKSFFQQNLALGDQWKLAFTTAMATNR